MKQRELRDKSTGTSPPRSGISPGQVRHAARATCGPESSREPRGPFPTNASPAAAAATAAELSALARHGLCEELRALHARGADFTKPNAYGWTLAHHAAAAGQRGVLELLAALGLRKLLLAADDAGATPHGPGLVLHQ